LRGVAFRMATFAAAQVGGFVGLHVHYISVSGWSSKNQEWHNTAKPKGFAVPRTRVGCQRATKRLNA
jgi:hypothetical protein